MACPGRVEIFLFLEFTTLFIPGQNRVAGGGQQLVAFVDGAFVSGFEDMKVQNVLLGIFQRKSRRIKQFQADFGI